MVIYLGILLLGLASALQSSVIPQIRILGGQPDLIFLLVLAWTINTRLMDGLIWAFIGGLMHNLLSAAPLGVSSLSMILLIFVIDSIRRQVYSIGLPLLVLLVLAGSLIHQLMMMLILSLIGYEIAFLDSLTYVVVPTIAYNLVGMWPVYWFIRRVQRRMAGGRPALT
jgi:rod shape-determining protein MreD